MRECQYHSLRKSHFLLNSPDCLYCSRPTSIWVPTCSPRAHWQNCFWVAFILKIPQGALAKALPQVRRTWNTTPGFSENLEKTILWNWKTSGMGTYVSSPSGCKKPSFYAINPWTLKPKKPTPKPKKLPLLIARISDFPHTSPLLLSSCPWYSHSPGPDSLFLADPVGAYRLQEFLYNSQQTVTVTLELDIWSSLYRYDSRGQSCNIPYPRSYRSESCDFTFNALYLLRPKGLWQYQEIRRVPLSVLEHRE